MQIQSLSSNEPATGFSVARPDAAAPVQQQSVFAAAVIRKTGSARAEDSPDLYGADARMLKILKERDQAARDAAKSEGEAVGGRQFIYQTGPDGRQYAVGSTARVLRREDDSAGGQAQGLPQYTYQTGPDGRAYAVGGAVNISVSSSGDAESAARQAETARRAALAAGETSTRDALTASQAGEIASRARQRALNAYAEAGQTDSRSDLSLTA